MKLAGIIRRVVWSTRRCDQVNGARTVSYDRWDRSGKVFRPQYTLSEIVAER